MEVLEDDRRIPLERCDDFRNRVSVEALSTSSARDTGKEERVLRVCRGAISDSRQQILEYRVGLSHQLVQQDNMGHRRP